jgi:integrase
MRRFGLLGLSWLASSAKPRVSERTFAEYAVLLRRYVREPLGKTMSSDVRALQIQNLYSQMQERGLSARVGRYTHAVLSSALKQAVRWGMLHRNPAELVQLPKLKRKELQAMTPAESARFLAALENDRYSALFSLALSTGMRPEEYLGLRWADVDFAKSSVLFNVPSYGEPKAMAGTSPKRRLRARAVQFPFPRQWCWH